MTKGKINRKSVNNPFLSEELLKQSVYYSTLESDSSDPKAKRVHAFAANVDEGYFVKVYSEYFVSKYLSLSVNAKAVIGCFILKMEMNDDIVEYSNQQLMVDSGLSINTLGKAINDLLSVALIARVSTDKRNSNYHSYFINPLYFFRGSKSVYYDKVYKLKANLDEIKKSS